MKSGVWIAGAGAVILAATAYFALGGYNVAADDPHWQLTSWVLETVRNRSIAARSSGIAVPPLDGEAQIREASGNYDAMCVDCHLRPGMDRSEQRAGLNPMPPDFTRQELRDPAAAYWTIRHGVKMTGMPGWGGHMDDESIWAMVALIRRLPGMSSERYRELVNASAGHSHGAGTERAPEPEPEQEATHIHADGSVHQH